jgi:stage V sporulation protein B
LKSLLIRGTLILAGAAFIARFLGVIQRIPLQRLLEDLGMASYAIAYNIYFWLLVLATAGFPSAVAKLVAEKYATGHQQEGEMIRQAAAKFAWVAGIIAALLVWLGAPLLAELSGNPDAVWAIQALAPALLIFPWIAVERGYFHGRQRMGANGLSQIWEQIFRVITAIFLAYLLLEWGFGLAWAAAGASFGGVLGSLAAATVMLYYGFRLRREDRQYSNSPVARVNQVRLRSIYRTIYQIALPVSITALAVPTIYLIDSLLTIPLLRHGIGVRAATETLGMLGGRAQSLAGIPVIFAIALSQSILPIIAAAYARNDSIQLEQQTSMALKLSLLSGVPVVIVLSVIIFPLNSLIFGDANGSWIIVSLLISVSFQILMMTSASILLGLGHAAIPMRHIAIGVGIKLVASILLAPYFGIYGITAATALCFFTTAVLNFVALRRLVPFTMLGSRFPAFMLTIFLQTAIGTVLAWWLYIYFTPFSLSILNSLVQTLIAATVATFLYPVLLLKTRVITTEDIEAMPSAVQSMWHKLEPILRKI